MCSHSSASSTGAHEFIIGGMTRGGGKKCSKGKAASKGPLAPALYAIGQHAALLAAQARLQADAKVVAAWTTSTSSQPCHAQKSHAMRGFVVLGVPIEHPAFIQAWADERLQEEKRLLNELPTFSAPGIPATLGRLGLQPAARTSPAAYWAAWADALHVICARRPRFAPSCAAELEGSVAHREHKPSTSAHPGADRLGLGDWPEVDSRSRPRSPPLPLCEMPRPLLGLDVGGLSCRSLLRLRQPCRQPAGHGQWRLAPRRTLALELVLDLADAAGPSTLPLRW